MESSKSEQGPAWAKRCSSTSTWRPSRSKRNYTKKESQVKSKEFTSLLPKNTPSNNTPSLGTFLIETLWSETSSLQDMAKRESCLFYGLSKTCLFLTEESVPTSSSTQTPFHREWPSVCWSSNSWPRLDPFRERLKPLDPSKAATIQAIKAF